MSDFIASLAIVVAAGILGLLIAMRLGLPPVIGLLLAGMAVGPFALGIIDNGQGIEGENFALMNQIGEVGAILLLFTLGIEFSIGKLLQGGRKIFPIFIAKVGLVFLSGFATMRIFGFDSITALYIGTIVAITSTAIFVKVLTDRKMYQREEVPTLIGVLIVEDIFAVFMLTFLSQISASEGSAIVPLLYDFAIAGVLLLTVYGIMVRVMFRVMPVVMRHQSDEVLAFIALSLCFGMAAIASGLGLASTAGAFLAGSIVATFPNARRFEKMMAPFTLVFVALFFLALGMSINPLALVKDWPLILTLSAVTALFGVVSVGAVCYFNSGMSSRSALFSGIALLPIGEFSLLIAQQGVEAGAHADLVSIATGILLIKAVLSSVLLLRTDALSEYIVKHTPPWLRADFELISLRVAKADHDAGVEGDRRIERQGYLWLIPGIALLLFGIFILPIVASYIPIGASLSALALACSVVGSVMLFKGVACFNSSQCNMNRKQRFVNSVRSMRKAWRDDIQVGFTESEKRR